VRPALGDYQARQDLVHLFRRAQVRPAMWGGRACSARTTAPAASAAQLRPLTRRSRPPGPAQQRGARCPRGPFASPSVHCNHSIACLSTKRNNQCSLYPSGCDLMSRQGGRTGGQPLAGGARAHAPGSRARHHQVAHALGRAQRAAGARRQPAACAPHAAPHAPTQELASHMCGQPPRFLRKKRIE